MIMNLKKIIFTIIVVMLPSIVPAQWQTVSSMNVARSSHTATLLTDGNVLVTGGYIMDNSLYSCEVYNPATGNWTITTPMKYSRVSHAAVLLDDGRVLVIGGYSFHAGSIYLKTCEIFDPEYKTWSVTDSLLTRFRELTAVLLKDGRVLVVGEADSLTSQIYDPSTETWQPAEVMNEPREAYSVVKLADGKVLVSGSELVGREGSFVLKSCEVYDPLADSWTNKEPMNSARAYHSSSLLPDENVLVAGGVNSEGSSAYPILNYTKQCEIYDPAQNSWSQTDSLKQARIRHATVSLNDGSVLMAGGIYGTQFGAEYYSLNNCEVYKDGKFSTTDSLEEARYWHRIVLLSNGEVLVTGGIGGTSSNREDLKSCEKYIPSITSVNDDDNEKLSNDFKLFDNYPNPFNPTTTIKFTVPSLRRGTTSPYKTKLIIYDILGQKITTLVDEIKEAGTYEVTFNGENLGSGIYCYVLTSGDFFGVKKMMLIK